ncbi:MAG: hypothetical protein ACKVQJ_01635 [Pyrinomonadaceae bacterium]
MTKRTKIIAIVAVVVMVPIIALVVIFAGVGYFILSDKEGSKMYSDAVAQGPEFGKTTDQNGCMNEGFARLKGVADPTIAQLSANRMFVRGCFETARPIADFCTNVPSIPFSDWVRSECKKLGKSDAACLNVMDCRHSFCNGL